jgi:ribosomal protein S18 acetylase RimI-like enzyme
MAAAVEITQATPDRLPALADLLGRAFVVEPMMRWSLGVHGDVEERFVRCFEYFLERVIPAGTVWEAGQALGATAWIAPGEMDVWRDAQMTETRMHELTEDGGLRYDAFWTWVDSRVPEGPLWFLDSVGVAGQARGRGIGGALIRFGLERARADDVDALLETGNPRNVLVYEHLGFRVVDAADAPDGGPRIWFMRWSPEIVAR